MEAEIRSAAGVPATSSPIEAQLQDEVRNLRAMVRQLSNRVEQLSIEAPAPVPAAPAVTVRAAAAAAEAVSGTGVLAGAGAAIRGPLEPRPTGRFDMPRPAPNYPAKASFSNGFQIQSDDGEFQWQFHDLTHFDGRYYTQGGQEPVTTTFTLSRQWYIMSGRLTKPFEYVVSFAQGTDTFNLLDAWLNVNFDPRLQFKIGRMWTPFGYEFYNVPTNALINGERSLFYNNVGPNRDEGIMAWGQLFQDRIGYGVGIFNGIRNGFVDTNDFKSVIGLINFRPFSQQKGSLLENFNVGGSVDFGKVDNVPSVNPFRTSVNTAGNTVVGPEFLQLNSNVREVGDVGIWSLHMAYFYRHLSVIAEWQSGFNDYAIVNNARTPVGGATGQLHAEGTTYRTHLPVSGYYVQAGYFLTGETVSGRGTVKPKRNFDVRRGKVGLGAIELGTRYSTFNIGREVFTAGLADPNLWTNSLYTIDYGVNWYWTEYVKVYIGVQHAVYADPVLFAPGKFQPSSDEIWTRFQIFF